MKKSENVVFVALKFLVLQTSHSLFLRYSTFYLLIYSIKFEICNVMMGMYAIIIVIIIIFISYSISTRGTKHSEYISLE